MQRRNQAGFLCNVLCSYGCPGTGAHLLLVTLTTEASTVYLTCRASCDLCAPSTLISPQDKHYQLTLTPILGSCFNGLVNAIIVLIILPTWQLQLLQPPFPEERARAHLTCIATPVNSALRDLRDPRHESLQAQKD